MYILKPKPKEEVLLNKAKRRFLKENPKIKGISDGKVVIVALREYVKGGKSK